jgi:hypothetical protein
MTEQFSSAPFVVDSSAQDDRILGALAGEYNSSPEEVRGKGDNSSCMVVFEDMAIEESTTDDLDTR